MEKGFYYIVALFAVSLLWPSCSTKKNTRATRFYHAFNSRYNIYFNGKESFDEALENMQDNYQESYTDMIYMYPISAQPKDKAETGGSFDRAIEKSNKAIKLHSIKAKPAKKPGWRNDPKQRAYQEQEEYNPFLKKCWLLMGQAQFYNADFLQASATFSYIARHYAHDEEVVAEARLWQARCYSELGWLYEAEDILDKMNKNGIPSSAMKLYATIYADYLVKDEQFEESIPYLKIAIKAEKNRKQRARMRYLLGQIYVNQGMDGMAYKAFKDVVRTNPPYELEFAARIRQAEVSPGANYQKVVKMLERMAKSQKNKDYLDQVYYALGNVYLNREDTVNAIKNYQMGIDKSTKNGLDKAVCQIKLGDIYFSQRDYVKAQPCFSGALAGIQKTYKEYDRISKLSAILDELVVHVEAVHLQDSLQALAKMPEAERLAIIDKRIEDLKKEEEEAKRQAEKEAYLAEQESKGSAINREGVELNTVVATTSSSGTTFYFYNSQTVAQGKTQFQRKWGRRTLEDNWRRRNKEISLFSDEYEYDYDDEEELVEEVGDSAHVGPAAPGDSINAGLPPVAVDDPHTREYYLQQLPFTQEDVDASNVIIVDGLFHIAMIYKDKLEDFPLSIEGFETLERRFPENQYRLESYYQVYLIALRIGDTALATAYRDKLMRVFPESNYAVAVADPNFEYNVRMMDTMQDSIYQMTYDRYLQSDTSFVRRSYQYVSEKYPLASLMPKFMFLEALTYVQAGDPEGFKVALKTLIEKYPKADVTALAQEMLIGVLRGRTLVQGGVRGMTWNLRFGVGEDGTLSAEDSARVFSPERNLPYQMLLVYPTGSVDQNQLLFAVAAYNFANFMVKAFDLELLQAGPISMLAIKGFINFDEIVQYYHLIYGEDGYANALNKAVAVLPISDDNYETLMRGKTLEEYITFFGETFGEELPDLVARWQARFEAEEEELLEEEEEAVEEEVLLEETPVDEAVAEPQRIERPIIRTEVQPMLAVPDQITIPVPEKQEILPTEPLRLNAVPVEQVPAEEEGMTLKEIQELRKREAAEEEARKEEARKAFEAQQKADKELRAQKAKEQEELRKQQAEEEEALLKAKEDREKQLEADRKAKLKQEKADRKAKLKAREQARKEKEKAYKQRQKEKEKELKEKEKAYKKKQKEKEKARKAALKEKERAAKEKERAAREKEKAETDETETDE